MTQAQKSWQMGGVRFYAGILISLVCLYLALQGIQLDRMWAALRSVDPFWLLASLAFEAVSYVGRVLRWQMLFYPRRVSFQNVFSVLTIGYLLSNILPARLGDLARAYLIGDREKLSKARALGTVVVERISDGLMVGVLLIPILLFTPQVPDAVRSGGILAGAAAAAILVVLTVLSRQVKAIAQTRRVREWLDRSSLFHRFWRLFESGTDGFAALSSVRPFGAMIGWSIAIWFFVILSYWAMLFAVGINLPLNAAALVVVVTGLVIVVPSSPGYIGVFHLVIQQTLAQIYGVDPAISLSYAILIHGMVYVSTSALGLLFLWREGVSVRDLSAQGAQAPLPET